MVFVLTILDNGVFVKIEPKKVICGAFLVRKLSVMDLVEKSNLNSMVDLYDF